MMNEFVAWMALCGLWCGWIGLCELYEMWRECRNVCRKEEGER